MNIAKRSQQALRAIQASQTGPKKNPILSTLTSSRKLQPSMGPTPFRRRKRH